MRSKHKTAIEGNEPGKQLVSSSAPSQSPLQLAFIITNLPCTCTHITNVAKIPPSPPQTLTLSFSLLCSALLHKRHQSSEMQYGFIFAGFQPDEFASFERVCFTSPHHHLSSIILSICRHLHSLFTRLQARGSRFKLYLTISPSQRWTRAVFHFIFLRIFARETVV
jgi:hypothetical protein